MPITPIGGPADPSPVWPPPSTLYDRMQKIITAFADRLAVQRDEIVTQLAHGRSLGQLAAAGGVPKAEAVALAARELAWQPGRPAMDPARVQATAEAVVAHRGTPTGPAGTPVEPAAALAAAASAPR